jgi:hypothetical protein
LLVDFDIANLYNDLDKNILIFCVSEGGSMSGKTRASILSLTVIAVMLFSAVGPTIVYADGETPETTPTETTSTPDETSSEATEAAAPEKGDESAAESGSFKEAAAPEATEEAAPVTEEAASDSSVLSEVPEDTTVTVLDENGEAQPLATQAAADAIATTSDPIWCPGDTAPGGAGCTQSFNSFNDLLTFIAGNASVSGPGTIYVQQGQYNGGESSIDFNNYNLSNISSSNLNVTGGWNPSDNSINADNPSIFTVPILIGSSTNLWGGSLSVSNINISNTNGTGLTLYSASDISLTNVDVVDVPNGAGAELHAPNGNVTVEDSNFEGNQTTGLIIRAGGNVAVRNSTFTDPEDPGQLFRQDIGLDIQSGGNTSLFGVLASGNMVGGTNINSVGRVTIGSSIFSGNMSILGVENPVFDGYGLQVVSQSAIELEDVEGNDNFLWGAKLTTTTAAGDIAIAQSEFNNNTTDSPGFIDDTGLFITSGNNVALDFVDANDNRLFGAQIVAAGSVSIDNSNFNNNQGETVNNGVTQYDGHGLDIDAGQSISLTNVMASGNSLFGAELNAGADVNISESEFNNNSTGVASAPLGQGLGVVSGSNVSLLNVELNNNQTVGADIQTPGDVFLDFVEATGNGTNGIDVQSRCVHVNGGTFSGNSGNGINLGTSALNLIAAPAGGDIVPSNPPTCSIILGGFSSGSKALLSVGSSNAPSLNSLLGRTNGSRSIFIGKYDYVYTNAGLQVFALSDSSNELALQ